MTRYLCYIELTSPTLAIEADSQEEAEKMAEEYINKMDQDIEFMVMTNLYVGEMWKADDSLDYDKPFISKDHPYDVTTE